MWLQESAAFVWRLLAWCLLARQIANVFDSSGSWMTSLGKVRATGVAEHCRQICLYQGDNTDKYVYIKATTQTNMCISGRWFGFHLKCRVLLHEWESTRRHVVKAGCAFMCSMSLHQRHVCKRFYGSCSLPCGSVRLTSLHSVGAQQKHRVSRCCGRRTPCGVWAI